MHRLLAVLAFSLGCLSLVPQAYADISAVPQTPPVYLNYMPFGVETLIPLSQNFFSGPLHQAISMRLDKAPANRIGGGIRRLTKPTDIQALRTLLRDPQYPIQALGSHNTRFLFGTDGGKTQIFVDTDGVASQGSHSWRLTSGDFTRLARTLGWIYAAPVSK